MKKIYWKITGYIVLLVLAGILLYRMCQSSNQAIPSFVIDTEFVGEYSLGGSEWKKIDKDTKLSAFDGDLVLKGQFRDVQEMYISFYLKHIGMTISVNGEQVFESGRTEDKMPEMICGSNWVGWLYEGANPKDEIEIRLHNPHRYGNADAYQEFLNSLYLGAGETLQTHIKQESMPYQVAGVVIIILSVVLLGMALGYLSQRLSFGKLLWWLGLLSLFMGGYFVMDTKDISFKSNLIVFNTCIRQYCIMFAGLAFVNCICKTLTKQRSKIAGYVTAVLGVGNGILLLLSLAGVLEVYDTGFYWAVMQGIISLIMLALCLLEEFQSGKADRVLLISYDVFLFAMCLEMVNGRAGFWTNGILIKVVFLLLFVFHMVRAVKLVTVNYQISIKTKKLEEELKNSRIALAMSQIQPHFIYNVLAAIRALCTEDSRAAVETIDRFSGFLRVSLETMDKSQCISFEKEMEMVENYVYLEQKRFDNKIKIETQIEAEDFMLPPMSVQPLVENAVRHGILKKDAGGTVSIKSSGNDKEYKITVTDDGAGLDMAGWENDGKVHVGLKNVEKRLKLMCKGSLEIVSTLGQGTMVTIRIPKYMKTDEK